MTIYTVTLINQQVRTNEPEVHVFTNEEEAKQFALTWMEELLPDVRLHFEAMEEYCTRYDVCSVDIQSHFINLPQEKTMNKIVLVTYESGVIRWYPYELNTLEMLSAECQYIEDIQIIECAAEKAQYIITKTV